jgi:preprotein translocase subunit SecA
MAGRGTDIVLGGNPEGFFESILHKHAEQVDYIHDIPTRTESDRQEKEQAIQEYIENMTQEEKDKLLAVKVTECNEDHQKVVDLGGLHIIGTERHESRRIDNQLRGRSGRQGDPGSTRFFLSLEDELMRRFAADRVSSIMERVGMDEETPLESRFVSRFIETAQTRVEGYNFDIRKNVVEYDDVIARQREVIYADRHKVLAHSDMHDRILDMVRNEIALQVSRAFPGPVLTEEEQLESLFKSLEAWVEIPEDLIPENLHALRRDVLQRDLTKFIIDYYEKRAEDLRKQSRDQGVENFDPMREFERSYLLQVVDRLWMDHIDSLDVMRAGIGFRSIGQRDPLVEFKNEAYRMFDDLKMAIQHYTVDSLLKLLRNDLTITLQHPEPQHKVPTHLQTNADALAMASGQNKTDEAEQATQKARNNARSSHSRRDAGRAAASVSSGSGAKAAPARASATVGTATAPASMSKVGRNDPCPCGSGKKYKKCHGA